MRPDTFNKVTKWTDSVCVVCGKEFRKPEYFTYNICESCDTIPSRPETQKLKKLKSSQLWIATLEHYKYKCAYCGDREAEQVEHFIPVRLGGNTDPYNCVPTCRKCNNRKYQLGDKLPGYENVRKYLEDLQNKHPDFYSKQPRTHTKQLFFKSNKEITFTRPEFLRAIKIIAQAKAYTTRHDDELSTWIKENMIGATK